MPNLYTPDFIYRTAKEYFRIGTVAAGQFFKNYFDDPHSYSKIQAPAVNIAFSLELALKAILLHERGKIPHGHIFHKLFGNISEDSRLKIEKYFQNNLTIGNPFPLIQYSKANKEEEKDSQNYSSFEEVLHHHQNAYNNWRYAHEFSINKNESLSFNFHSMTMATSACLQHLEIDILA